MKNKMELIDRIVELKKIEAEFKINLEKEIDLLEKMLGMTEETVPTTTALPNPDDLTFSNVEKLLREMHIKHVYLTECGITLQILAKLPRAHVLVIHFDSQGVLLDTEHTNHIKNGRVFEGEEYQIGDNEIIDYIINNL